MTPEILAAVDAAAKDAMVPPHLLRALVEHESGGNPDAVGDGGLARGLGQMHPTACQAIGMDHARMSEPVYGALAAANYLRWCLDLFGWEVDWALAAYNQGPTVIRNAWRYAAAVKRLMSP